LRSFPFHLGFGIFSPIHFHAKIPTSKQTLIEILYGKSKYELEYFLYEPATAIYL
jgi:hypothetical protein